MKRFLAACLFIGLGFSQAFGAECRVFDAALKCEGEPTAALASDKTGQLFINPLEKLSLYKDRAAAERFRLSLERVWRAANRDAKRLEFRHRRGRISGSEFQAFVEIFAKAETHYELGIDLYRNLVWQGRFDRLQTP